jgi:hypothetical protein
LYFAKPSFSASIFDRKSNLTSKNRPDKGDKVMYQGKQQNLGKIAAKFVKI